MNPVAVICTPVRPQIDSRCLGRQSGGLIVPTLQVHPLPETAGNVDNDPESSVTTRSVLEQLVPWKHRARTLWSFILWRNLSPSHQNHGDMSGSSSMQSLFGGPAVLEDSLAAPIFGRGNK